MEVYALDATNIDDFDFLVEPSALRAVKREEAHGFCVKTDGAHVGALVGRFTDDKEYEIMSLLCFPNTEKQEWEKSCWKPWLMLSRRRKPM